MPEVCPEKSKKKVNIMENENSAASEVRTKRKYIRRIKPTVSGGGNSGSVGLHGIKLEVDPDCVQRLKLQQVAERENEFRREVLAKFENHIASVKKEIQESGDVPESLELPETVGMASASFSSTPTADRVLIPGNDYAIRVHVGLMALMNWSTGQIVSLQKEIEDLKSNSSGTVVQSAEKVNPAVAPSDDNAQQPSAEAGVFFTS
jgi:hypothetical protein